MHARHRLDEFTIWDFKGQGSDLTKSWRTKRNKSKGRESQLAKVVDYDAKTNVLFILTDPTYDPRMPIVPAGDAGSSQTDIAYTMQVKFVELDLWAEAWDKMTVAEFKEILTVADVKLDCDCMSFHWQGHRYNLSQIDSAIYPTSIADPEWSPRHKGKGGLCKHLLGFVNFAGGFGANILFSQIKKKMLSLK